MTNIPDCLLSSPWYLRSYMWGTYVWTFWDYAPSLLPSKSFLYIKDPPWSEFKFCSCVENLTSKQFSWLCKNCSLLFMQTASSTNVINQYDWSVWSCEQQRRYLWGTNIHKHMRSPTTVYCIFPYTVGLNGLSIHMVQIHCITQCVLILSLCIYFCLDLLLPHFHTAQFYPTLHIAVQQLQARLHHIQPGSRVGHSLDMMCSLTLGNGPAAPGLQRSQQVK